MTDPQPGDKPGDDPSLFQRMWLRTTHYEKVAQAPLLIGRATAAALEEMMRLEEPRLTDRQARALVRALFAVDPVLPRIDVQPSTLRRGEQMAQ